MAVNRGKERTMEIIEKSKNKYGDEVVFKKDATTDIVPVFTIEVEGKKIFETSSIELAEVKFFNIATNGC